MTTEKELQVCTSNETEGAYRSPRPTHHRPDFRSITGEVGDHEHVLVYGGCSRCDARSSAVVQRTDFEWDEVCDGDAHGPDLKPGDGFAFDTQGVTGALSPLTHVREGCVDGDILYGEVVNIHSPFPSAIDAVDPGSLGGYEARVYSSVSPPRIDHFGFDFFDWACLRLSADEMRLAREAGWPRTRSGFRSLIGHDVTPYPNRDHKHEDKMTSIKGANGTNGTSEGHPCEAAEAGVTTEAPVFSVAVRKEILRRVAPRLRIEVLNLRHASREHGRSTIAATTLLFDQEFDRSPTVNRARGYITAVAIVLDLNVNNVIDTAGAHWGSLDGDECWDPNCGVPF